MAQLPANRYLHYRLNHTGDSADSHYFDLFKDLSMTNRRLYRQGQMLHVKSVTIQDSTQTSNVKINVVPDTWVSRRAWKRAKFIFDEMNEEALKSTGRNLQLPTYHDFKVQMNASMKTDPDFLSNTPGDHNANVAQAGEWTYSQFETDAGQYTTGFLGGDSDTDGNGGIDYVGLIQSYGETKSVPNAPMFLEDTDGEDDRLSRVLSGLDDEPEEIIENLHTDNDRPPYCVFGSGADGDETTLGDAFPGASMNMPSSTCVGMLAVGGNSNPDVMRMGAFQAICGLVEVETTSASNNTIDIIFEVAVGNYKGVKTSAI